MQSSNLSRAGVTFLIFGEEVIFAPDFFSLHFVLCGI